MKHKGALPDRWTGIPPDQVCFSQVIKPFLHYIDKWRKKHNPKEQVDNYSIETEVQDIEKRVSLRF